MLIDFKTNADKIFNKLFYDLLKAVTRFVLNYGGAGSSKSYTQTQIEIVKALKKKEKILVIRKVNTTLKHSVISLFTSILNSWGLQEMYTENKSLQTIVFSNGSEIIFKGLDDSEKIKSIAGITRIWIEEATEITKEDFNQLNLRLRGAENLQVTLTFNPIDEEHWIKKYFFDTPQIREHTTIIKTTYKDNKFIDEAYKIQLEGYKDIDENYHKIYALGEFGGLTEGRIFKEWTVQPFPENGKHWYGLDFGYSADPTAILRVYTEPGQRIKIWVDEVCYMKGMLNSEIANYLRSDGYSGQPVICDSAEPKSIDELRQYGINAIGADKRPGSINAGIDFLKSAEVFISPRSSNLAHENRYYRWKTDKNGKFINQPIDAFNHCFDKYTKVQTINGEKEIYQIKLGEYVLTTNGYKKVLSSGITGCNKIFDYKIKISNFEVSLKCTDNHLIYTNIGWKQISELKEGMIIFLSKNLTEKYTDYTKEKGIFQEVEKGFISLFGNITTERLKKGTTFITKTKMYMTTGFKTLILSMQHNILKNMESTGLKTIKNGSKNFIKRELKQQYNGIKAKKVLIGIFNTLKTITLVSLIMAYQTVLFAIQNMKKRKKMQNFVQINANHNTEEIWDMTTKQEYVLYAIKNLHLPNIQDQNVVQGYAVRSIEKNYIKTDLVYDLTVDETPEFFANGILVHNCLDSLRYSVSLYDQWQPKELFVDVNDL